MRPTAAPPRWRNWQRAEAAGEAVPALLLVDAAMPGATASPGRPADSASGTAAGTTVMLLSDRRPSGRQRPAAVTWGSAIPAKPVKRVRPLAGRAPLPGAADQRADRSGRTSTRRGAAPAAERLPRRRRLRVLLVDDNAFNQKVAASKLRAGGHDGRVAGSGREALAAVERQPFDLVFMDMQMPDMDGLEATRPSAGGSRARTGTPRSSP